MSLNIQLSEAYQGFLKNAPAEAVSAITSANADFKAAFDPESAIKIGDTLPSFALSNALGSTINSTDLLDKGPLLLTFYRGSWCPYCNLALASLQSHLTAIKSAGVTLVAITPELPNTALSTVEKNSLEFHILSDVGNVFAEKLGIVYQQPNSLRPAFAGAGIDFKKSNGDDSFSVPIPATLLVDRYGVVRNMFLDTDYTKRLEPEAALKWIENLVKPIG